MTHDDPEQRERAQAQSDQAVQELLAVRQQLELAQAQSDQSLQELLAVTQELARQQRTFALLQRMSPELAHRMGRSLFDQMLQTAGDRAAEEAAREFSECFAEGLSRRDQPDKPQ
jgi:hypothetical protein